MTLIQSTTPWLYRIIVFSLLLFALPPVPVHAVTVSGMDAAIILHNAGRDGDSKATATAVEFFETLVAAEPGNMLANAYLGSSYALTARDAGSVVDKIRFANRGLRYLDLAVSQEPNNMVILLIRANVEAILPAMFGRVKRATEDMLKLDQMFSARPDRTLAHEMESIYNKLSDRAPEGGDWKAKAASARAMAGM